MDCSEIYIKMCDCEEIQKQREYLMGDYFATIGTEDGNPMWTVFDGFDDIRAIEDDIWLPRQDQLQEMFKYNNHLNLLNAFHWWVFDVMKMSFPFSSKEVSMEQLWLAFVMSERYSKQWNGKKWVKIKHGKPTD